MLPSHKENVSRHGDAFDLHIRRRNFDSHLPRRRRGGITLTFPLKLHALLMKSEQLEIVRNAMHWIDGGSAFVLTDLKFAEVLPNHFRAERLESFQRHLSDYGFIGSKSGAGEDCISTYRHERFHRDRPELLKTIRRRNATSGLSDASGDTGSTCLHYYLTRSIDHRPRFSTAATNSTSSQYVRFRPDTTTWWPGVPSPCPSTLPVCTPTLLKMALGHVYGDEQVFSERCQHTLLSSEEWFLQMVQACNVVSELVRLSSKLAPSYLPCAECSVTPIAEDISCMLDTVLDEAAAAVMLEEGGEGSLISLDDLIGLWNPEDETLSNSSE